MEASPEVISDLEKKCNWLDYDAADIIIDRDDTTTDVYFIVKGKVKIMDFLADNQEIALGELEAGSNFGELSAVDAKKRSARVTAVQQTVLASLPRGEFRKLLIECPGIGLTLLKKFAGLIRTLNTRVTALSTLSPAQRVYYELLRMSEPNPQGDGTWIIQNIPKHDDIASWSGTDSKDVATAIGRLAREGVVGRKNRSLIIKDHARLQMLLNL